MSALAWGIGGLQIPADGVEAYPRVPSLKNKMSF